MTSTLARLPIDIRRFPWIRRLAADYAYDYARLAPFFAGNPADPAAWRSAIASAQQHPRNRSAIAEVIATQQRRRGAPAQALAAGERLRDASTIAIVTGQQAGLFGGPLFTLLKALTTIRLAEQIAAQYDVPTVPIFWIDAEDHDWDEVKNVGVFDGGMELVSIDVGNLPGANHEPVASVRLDAAIDTAISALASALPASEFTPALLDRLRATYSPGTGMSEAFGRWLESVLGPMGLVVFDSADRTAKPLVSGLFAREIEHAGETSRLAAEAGARLEGLGYHAQVAPQRDQAALFHLNGGRQSIHADGNRSALAERARSHPEEFSPNVLLRPLVQDTLFPTACYVAGPNELAYLAQLGGVYAAFGVPMPLMQLRATATIVDSNALRFLTRYDIPFESLRAQDEAVLNQLLAAQLPATVERSLDEAERVLAERMEALAAALPEIDNTLEGAARAALGRMQDDLKKLRGKIIQAAKRKDDTLRRQFTHARAQAFPGGHPQERAIGFVSFLNKYGPGFVERVSEELPLDTGIHWVMTI